MTEPLTVPAFFDHSAAAPAPAFQLPVLEDRPIYHVADRVGTVFPYAWATGAALSQPGDRYQKMRTGGNTLSYLLAFQLFDRLWNKGMRFIYNRNPELADKINRHRILLGGPVAVAGFFLSVFGARQVYHLTDRLLQTRPANTAAHAMLDNRVADTVINKAVRPVNNIFNRVMRSKFFIVPAAIAGLGFLGTLLFRTIQDNLAFSRQYKQARQDIPMDEMSPYALRNQLLMDQYV